MTGGPGRPGVVGAGASAGTLRALRIPVGGVGRGRAGWVRPSDAGVAPGGGVRSSCGSPIICWKSRVSHVHARGKPLPYGRPFPIESSVHSAYPRRPAPAPPTNARHTQRQAPRLPQCAHGGHGVVWGLLRACLPSCKILGAAGNDLRKYAQLWRANDARRSRQRRLAGIRNEEESHIDLSTAPRPTGKGQCSPGM